jgi:hypothetical protein
LHCRQMLTTVCQTPKRAWQRMPLLHSPWAKSLSLGVIPGRLADGDGPGSRPVTQVWFWHCTCYCSNRGSVWDPARVPSPDSRFARESPIRQDRTRRVIAISGSRRQVGTCPISVLEASPASSTSWLDFLMPPEPLLS